MTKNFNKSGIFFIFMDILQMFIFSLALHALKLTLLKVLEKELWIDQ